MKKMVMAALLLALGGMAGKALAEGITVGGVAAPDIPVVVGENGVRFACSGGEVTDIIFAREHGFTVKMQKTTADVAFDWSPTAYWSPTPGTLYVRCAEQPYLRYRVIPVKGILGGAVDEPLVMTVSLDRSVAYELTPDQTGRLVVAVSNTDVNLITCRDGVVSLSDVVVPADLHAKVSDGVLFLKALRQRTMFDAGKMLSPITGEREILFQCGGKRQLLVLNFETGYGKHIIVPASGG